MRPGIQTARPVVKQSGDPIAASAWATATPNTADPVPLSGATPSTETESRRVLLVGGSESDHRLIELLLTSRNYRTWHGVRFSLDHQPDLSRALDELQTRSWDAILLDLCSPGGCNLDSLSRIAAIHHAPVIVLSCHQSLVTAVEALRRGAEDTLEIQELTSHHLTSSLLHAMERFRRQVAEKQLTSAPPEWYRRRCCPIARRELMAWRLPAPVGKPITWEATTTISFAWSITSSVLWSRMSAVTA